MVLPAQTWLQLVQRNLSHKQYDSFFVTVTYQNPKFVILPIPERMSMFPLLL